MRNKIIKLIIFILYAVLTSIKGYGLKTPEYWLGVFILIFLMEIRQEGK